jgi:hypothetical protein
MPERAIMDEIEWAPPVCAGGDDMGSAQCHRLHRDVGERESQTDEEEHGRPRIFAGARCHGDMNRQLPIPSGSERVRVEPSRASMERWSDRVAIPVVVAEAPGAGAGGRRASLSFGVAAPPRYSASDAGLTVRRQSGVLQNDTRRYRRHF